MKSSIEKMLLQLANLENVFESLDEIPDNVTNVADALMMNFRDFYRELEQKSENAEELCENIDNLRYKVNSFINTPDLSPEEYHSDILDLCQDCQINLEIE